MTTARERIEGLKADLERARSCATALEQQVAALTTALNVALYYAINPRLHSPAAREQALTGCQIVLGDVTRDATREWECALTPESTP